MSFVCPPGGVPGGVVGMGLGGWATGVNRVVAIDDRVDFLITTGTTTRINHSKKVGPELSTGSFKQVLKTPAGCLHKCSDCESKPECRMKERFRITDFRFLRHDPDWLQGTSRRKCRLAKTVASVPSLCSIPAVASSGSCRANQTKPQSGFRSNWTCHRGHNLPVLYHECRPNDGDLTKRV